MKTVRSVLGNLACYDLVVIEFILKNLFGIWTLNMANNQQKFDPELTSATLEQLINKTTKNLPVEMLDWMKKIFESNMSNFFLGNKQEITVTLVVDSSSVIRALNYYAKDKTSIFFKLAQNPIFPLWSPPELENEVIDYIENKAKKSFSKNKLRSGWEQLKKIIEIKEIQNSESIQLAKQIMTRDQNDVSFVSLIIDTNASAIVSEDHDFDAIKHRFKIEQLGDVVGVYHRGLLSFTIMSELAPPVVKFAGGLIIIIINTFYEFLARMTKVIKGIVSGSIDGILKACSHIPSWVILVLAILGMTVIFLDSVNKKILNEVKSMYAKAKSSIKKIVLKLITLLEKLLTYVKKLIPYAESSAIILGDLYHNIALLKTEIMNLKAENIAHFS